MKRFVIVAAMTMLAVLPASRADLLVRKDGQSAWMASYDKKADSLSYKTTEDGATQTIPMSEVDAIIPLVRTGMQYTTEQADKALEAIKRAAGRHPKLRKQMELLKQQWQQVRDPDTGADGKIDELVRQFRDSDKSPRKFQDIAVRMEMIGLRDAVGALAAKIKKNVTEMQQEVFETARVRIETMSKSDKKTLEDYNTLRKLVSEVKMVRATDEQKKYLDEVHEKYRKETMQSVLQASKAAFFAAKTVDGYLESMAILGDLKRSEVPVSDADKAEVDRHIRVILSAAKTECKGYDFEFKGYPLDAQDKKLLAGRKLDSSGATGSLPSVEHCYMIATGVPTGSKQGDMLTFPVRLIFNRTPVPGGKYSLVADFAVPGNFKREIKEVSLQGIKAGHVDTELKVTIPRLEPKFSGSTPEPWNGITGMLLVLAYQGYRTPFSEQAEWIAATGGCLIGIGTPRPVPASK